MDDVRGLSLENSVGKPAIQAAPGRAQPHRLGLPPTACSKYLGWLAANRRVRIGGPRDGRGFVRQYVNINAVF